MFNPKNFIKNLTIYIIFLPIYMIILFILMTSWGRWGETLGYIFLLAPFIYLLIWVYKLLRK